MPKAFKDMTALDFVRRMAEATQAPPLILAAVTLETHPDYVPDDSYFAGLAADLMLCWERVAPDEPATGVYRPAPKVT